MKQFLYIVSKNISSVLYTDETRKDEWEHEQIYGTQYVETIHSFRYLCWYMNVFYPQQHSHAIISILKPFMKHDRHEIDGVPRPLKGAGMSSGK
jgi:hypothetical protein